LLIFHDIFVPNHPCSNPNSLSINQNVKMSIEQLTTAMNGLALESTNLMTIPAEIRLKIFEAVFAEVKVGIAVTPSAYGPSVRPWLLYPQIIRDPEHTQPFAIMTASKQTWRETRSLAQSCPISLTVWVCGETGGSPRWSTFNIPPLVTRRIVAITRNHWGLKVQTCGQ
jgi:hypothetical protein